MRSQAARQEGAIGRDQLARLGCDWNHWSRAKRNGRWTTRSSRVLVLEGVPETPEQRAWAGVLDAGGGAFLHGASTLAWFGLRGYDLSKVRVARCRGGRHERATLAVVHHLRDIRPDDVCVVRGLPTETVMRAIWSEASRFANERWYEIGLIRIGRLLDDAHRAGLLPWGELRESVEALASRGRAGVCLLRELAAAEQRQPGTSPTDSRNEDRLEAILANSRVPPLLRQRQVGGVKPIGRVDHRDPELAVVVETNSVTFHSTRSDQVADEARYAALVAAGFSVAVVWEGDLWSHAGNVVDTVQRARRLARLGESGVVHSAGCPWPFDPDRIVVPLNIPDTRG